MEFDELFFQPDELRPQSPLSCGFWIPGATEVADPSSLSSWESFEVEPPTNAFSLESFDFCESPFLETTAKTTVGGEEEKEEIITVKRKKSEVKNMQQPTCHVCGGPNASTLHFGGRSCKACAAFFRRTISMMMNYQCIGEEEEKCKIHFQLRMICRRCRFIKCVSAGMNAQLVQAKKEGKNGSKRKSRGLIMDTGPKEELSFDEYISGYGTQASSSYETPKSGDESDSNPHTTNTSVASFSPPPAAPTPTSSNGMTYIAPPDSNIFQDPFDPQQPSTSQNFNQPLRILRNPYKTDSESFALLDLFVKTEMALNMRRRVMYTNMMITNAFDTFCECPYERNDLKQFDYRTFCGFVKHDFLMVLDYVNTFPSFSQLSRSEKNGVYRMACAVDSMLCSAYYTYRVGIKENFLVLFNGDYIAMDPVPMTGTEPNAADLFDNNSDFDKYKTLMPLKLKQYFDMAVPFAELNVSFEEFVLLKALTIWQISYYNLEGGRKVAIEQRNMILRALHKIVEDRGDEDPAIRVGQLLLSMSYITEQVQQMTASYVVMTFFDVVSCDSVMHDIVYLRYEE